MKFLHAAVVLPVCAAAWVASLGPCFSANLLASVRRSEAPNLHLTAAQAADFPVALGEIAKQGKVAILVEGRPFYTRLTADKAAPLAPDAPLDEFVDRLAAAYDYQVLRKTARGNGLAKRRQNTVFVLQKKYTDPRDIPSLTLDECLRCAKRYKECIDVFTPNPVPTNTQTLQNIYRSLSPEQIEAMSANQLTIASLSADQKARLRPLTMLLYTGSESGGIRQLIAQLEKTRDATLFNTVLSDKLIHYGYYSGTDSRHWAGIATIKIPPFTPKEPEPPLNPQLPRDTAAQPMTAGAFGVWLNQSERRGEEPATYAIDSALAGKRFLATGLDNAAPSSLFQGLQDMYNLRVMQGASTKERLLTTAFAPLPRSLQDLQIAVRRTLPDDLLRSMHDDRRLHLQEVYRDAKKRIAAQPKSTDVNPELVAASNVAYEAITELSAISDALTNRSQYAIGFLLTEASKKQAEESRGLVFTKTPGSTTALPKPLIDRDGNSVAPLQFPVSKLGPQGTEYLVASAMTEIVYTTATHFGRETPTYITDIDSLYLVGKVYERNGKKMLAMHFASKDPKTGDVSLQGGIFDVKAPDDGSAR